MKFTIHSTADNTHFHSALNNNRGSALIVALLMLVVLTLIGISATTTTTFELQIAGNDKLYKRAFYAADGATEMGGELIEQNIEERDWNNLVARGNVWVWRRAEKPDGTVVLLPDDGLGNPDGNLYMNRQGDMFDATTDEIPVAPSDTNHDAIYPLDAVDTTTNPWTVRADVPHTNIKAVGNTTLSTGSAVQLIAGYEGKGKGAAGGGAWITYDVRAERKDVRDTDVRVRLGWRHVL